MQVYKRSYRETETRESRILDAYHIHSQFQGSLGCGESRLTKQPRTGEHLEDMSWGPRTHTQGSLQQPITSIVGDPKTLSLDFRGQLHM